MKDMTLGIYWRIQGGPSLRRAVGDRLFEGVKLKVETEKQKGWGVSEWSVGKKNFLCRGKIKKGQQMGKICVCSSNLKSRLAGVWWGGSKLDLYSICPENYFQDHAKVSFHHVLRTKPTQTLLSFPHNPLKDSQLGLGNNLGTQGNCLIRKQPDC
jgi:hypothetical protein